MNAVIAYTSAGGSVILAVHLAEHGIDRTHDRHHVRYLVPGHDVGQDGQVRKGRPPPLHAVRLRPAVAHDVAADLAPRALHPRVALALRNSDLSDRLHARPRRDRSLRKPVERLAHDPDRLPELDHPHAVARVAVAGGLDRNFEVEVPVRRVGLGPPHVVTYPRAPDERARNADRLGELPRDHTDALCARAEEGVLLEHGLVFVEPRLDEVDRLAHLLVPT